jgi:hypothetical protein
MRFDPSTLYDASGQLKRLQDLPEEVRIALAEVDVDPISADTASKFQGETCRDRRGVPYRGQVGSRISR